MRVRIDRLSWAPSTTSMVLRDVSLEVEPGQFLSIVGPNGSGKSSLLRCAYRVLRPSSGSVLLNDVNVWSLTPREVARDVAVLTQASSVAFDFTVGDIVALGRIPHAGSCRGEQDEEVVYDALNVCRLLPLAQRSFRTLSGGEKQRVLVARVIAQQPRLLILDEPTNHLDLRAQHDVMALARRLEVTTVAALHDLTLAARISDRVLMMRAGEIVADGDPKDVLTAERISAVFELAVDVFPHPTNGHLVIEPMYEAF